MISQALARQLKDAGLVWHTSVHDFFTIPDRDLDGRIFVLSDMMVTMELLRGWPAMMFHGASEWAMDYLLTHEAVWMPTESQLREKLEEELAVRNGRFHQLQRQDEEYVCEVVLNGTMVQFTAVDPSEAYGLALLDLLKKPPP